MGLTLVLNDGTQQIVYVRAPGSERGEVKLFRTKSDVTKTPVKDHTGRTLNFIASTQRLEPWLRGVYGGGPELGHGAPPGGPS